MKEKKKKPKSKRLDKWSARRRISWWRPFSTELKIRQDVHESRRMGPKTHSFMMLISFTHLDVHHFFFIYIYTQYEYILSLKYHGFFFIMGHSATRISFISAMGQGIQPSTNTELASLVKDKII